MAFYDYECNHCGHKFTVSKSISKSQDPEECPVCGKDTKKLIAGFTPRFKGPGFYSTDNAKGRFGKF